MTSIHSDLSVIQTFNKGGGPQRPPHYVACAEMVNAQALGRCAAGAEVATIDVDFGGAVIERSKPMSEVTWPGADVLVEDLSAMQIDMIVVSTDGTAAAVEQSRTVLERNFPKSTGFAPETISELKALDSRQIDRYRQLANVVLLTSLPIAGCSLAVSVAGGLAERRRPFSLLRLTGVAAFYAATHRRLEAAVPLILSIPSPGQPAVAADLFLRAQLQQTLQAPGFGYFTLVIAGVVASLAIIASTMPLLLADHGRRVCSQRLTQPGRVPALRGQVSVHLVCLGMKGDELRGHLDAWFLPCWQMARPTVTA